MRRAFAIFASLVVVAAFAASPSAAQQKGKAQAQRILNVYNWSDYVDPAVLEEFTKTTGIKLRYDTFDTNDMLEAKLLAGRSGYDVVAPTGYFLQRQIKAKIFQPLDKSKLPNLVHLWPEVSKRLAQYDPGNVYAVNYMWGTTGIGYNVAKARELLGANAKIDSWDIVFKPENLARFKDCGIHMLDSADDILPAALRYLGLDPNSTREAELQKAVDLMMTIRPLVSRSRRCTIPGRPSAPPATLPTRMTSRSGTILLPSRVSPSRIVQSPAFALANTLIGRTHGGGSGSGAAPAEADAYDQYLSDPNKPVPYVGHVQMGMQRDYMTEDQRFAATQPRAVATIIAAARQPVTLEQLRAGLDAVAPELVAGGPDEGWWAGLKRGFSGVFVVREASSASPDPNARIARARLAIENGQVDLALAEVARLPNRDKATAWIAMARRYVESHRALDLLEAAAITSAEREPAEPVKPTPEPAEST